MEDLVIIGVGFPDIIQTINDINRKQKLFNIVGFLDDNMSFKNTKIFGYPVIDNIEWLKKHKHISVVNTVAKDINIRRVVHKKLEQYEINFPNIIHPSVNIEYSKIGIGNLISKNVYLEVRSKINNHCMILPNVTVGHDAEIKDNCFIGPSVNILGGVKIEKDCLIGAGSIIYPKRVINNNATTSINSTIYNDVKENDTMLSAPSKRIFTTKS